MSVSFNTTSVATLDKLGKLYKTAVPQSDDPATEALVYSTATIAENKLKPIKEKVDIYLVLTWLLLEQLWRWWL